MILTWNPQRWDFEPGEYDGSVAQTHRTPPTPVQGGWSVGRRRHGVVVGERAFLLRQGSDRRGIVASGAVASEPYPEEHWDGSGAEAWFVEVVWDRFVDVDDRLPTDLLIEQVPSVPWNYLFASGNPLDVAAEDAIERLWASASASASTSTSTSASTSTSTSTSTADDAAAGGGANAEHGFPAEVREAAIDLLRRLIGIPLSTVRGRPNRILGVTPPTVLVSTERAPDGSPVPIQDVEDALDALRANGSVVIDPENMGYRSSFIGAVLLTLPGAQLSGTPPILTIAGIGAPRPTAASDGASDQVVTFEGDLTHIRETDQRGEQAALRRRLLGTQDQGTCALCGETYPVRFLYAAHIKPRAVCSERERRDLSSIAMPACAFGCDALFEAGYLAIAADGKILASSRSDVAGTLAEHLTNLQGRECLAVTNSNQKYFQWHHDNRFRG